MKTRQDIIRLRLTALKMNYGTPNKFICQRTGITEPVLSRFVRGIFNLQQEDLDRLEKFLSDRGYGDDLKCFIGIVQGR